MIFQHTLPQVLSGEKTQTRRLVSPQHEAVVDPDGEIVTVKANGRAKWVVGRTYAVQPGRTLPQVARIRVTHIKQELVTAISAEDALAEGYPTPAEFLQSWQKIHGTKHDKSQVWVVSFELVEVESNKV